MIEKRWTLKRIQQEVEKFGVAQKLTVEEVGDSLKSNSPFSTGEQKRLYWTERRITQEAKRIIRKTK